MPPIPASGFVLIEDLGDELYADVLSDGRGDERTLYESAAEVLAALHAEARPGMCCSPTRRCMPMTRPRCSPKSI